MHQLPTTNVEIGSGTSEMALEIQRIYDETDLPDQKVFIMGGHEEGIFSFGGVSPFSTRSWSKLFDDKEPVEKVGIKIAVRRS